MLAVQVDYYRAVETERANKAQERIRKKELSETIRANAAREAETQRANKEQERLTAERNAEVRRANQANEEIARYQAQTARMSHDENVRHNMAMEATQNLQAQAARTQAFAAQSQAQAAQRNAETNRMSLNVQSEANQIKRDTSLMGLIGTVGASLLGAGGRIGSSLINNWARNNAQNDGLSVLWSIGE